MKRDSILTRTFHISPLKKIDAIVGSFSLTGKILFSIFAFVFCASSLWMLMEVNNHYIVQVPQSGGTLIEGVIGHPRFINPLLAVTDGDKDIASLVYSGLLRHTPEGEYVPDLAESYTVSPDGRIYTFTLRDNATFHDGTPVTTDDVEFTIHAVQDARIQSVKLANWQGVTVEKMGDRQVKFILRQPYVPFLENASIGILPKHLWQGISVEAFPLHSLNTRPIGSGPYKIESIEEDETGVPSVYELDAFSDYALGTPHIAHIVIKFFQSEQALVDAYLSGTVEAINGISPMAASQLERKSAMIATSTLPRVFGVFFNQGQNTALAAPEVRQALDKSINREHIINTVLQGYGSPLAGPVPDDFLDSTIVATATPSFASRTAEANELLEKNGWTLTESGIREKKTAKGTVRLAFSVSTSDAPELKRVAEIMRDEWRKIGADVDIKIFEGGYLNQNVIRPRKYDALLFGQVVNRNLDLFAFWHSSQREDPGLNIALYSNPAADQAIERLRATPDKATRLAQYKILAAEIRKDTPALFLYAPEFIYVRPQSIRNLTVNHIAVPSERWSSIKDWYINTDNVWKIFLSNN